MKTNERAKYTNLTVELVPTPEDTIMLKNTWKAHKRACNRFSQKFYDESLKGKNKYKNWKTAYASASGLAKGRGGLHSIYGRSIIENVMKAYERNEKKGKSELILFGEYGEKNIKIPTIHLDWTNAFQMDFKAKKCQLDLADSHRTIDFSFFEEIPEPPESWKAIKAYLKPIYGSWYLTVKFSNPTANMEISPNTNIVGIDRGEINIATTYSLDKGAKRYSAKDYSLPCEGGTKDEHHKNLFAKDVIVAQEIVERESPDTIFVLEDLHFNKLRKGWSYRHFDDVLTYFAALRHQIVFYCDPRNTSRTCSNCGEVDKTERNLDEHRFICHACGYGKEGIVNDDENAAKNIYFRGRKELLKEG